MAQTVDHVVRTYEGVSLPPVGAYAIDPAHTNVEFVARHMLSKVRGRFTELSGTVTVGEEPGSSGARITVDTASITTDNEQRDAHLHSSDFFETDAHPQLTFVSTRLRPTGGTSFELDGDLSIRGITKRVTLVGEFLGWGVDGWGNDRVFAEAKARVNREDWGLVWNMAVEISDLLVAKEVDLEIQVQAVRQPADGS